MAANIRRRGKRVSLRRHLSIRPRFFMFVRFVRPRGVSSRPPSGAKAASSRLPEPRSHAASSSHLTGMKALIMSDSAPVHRGGH